MDEELRRLERLADLDPDAQVKHALVVERQEGWPTLRFYRQLGYILGRKRWFQNRKKIDIFADAEMMLVAAHTIVRAITVPHEVDRDWHHLNLVTNRKWLQRWLDEGWYQRWLRNTIYMGETMPNEMYWTIVGNTRSSIEAFERGDLYQSIVAAQRSADILSWPSTWALRYVKALQDYLVELYAPKNYAWSMIRQRVSYTNELDHSSDYIYIGAAIEEKIGNEYRRPSEFSQTKLMTIGTDTATRVLIPCSMGQTGYDEDHFIFRPNDSAMYTMSEIEQMYRMGWEMWLGGFRSAPDEYNENYYIRATPELAFRWAILMQAGVYSPLTEADFTEEQFPGKHLPASIYIQ